MLVLLSPLRKGALCNCGVYLFVSLSVRVVICPSSLLHSAALVRRIAAATKGIPNVWSLLKTVFFPVPVAGLV